MPRIRNLIVTDAAVYWKGAIVPFYHLEKTLFCHLYEGRGSVHARETLFVKLYGATPEDGGPILGQKMVDVYLSKIRRKLEKLKIPIQIIVIYTVGYIMLEQKVVERTGISSRVGQDPTRIEA